jgi:EAL domain-containing protein (putative c-di-GMP-specific phosphodiesterase class I)
MNQVTSLSSHISPVAAGAKRGKPCVSGERAGARTRDRREFARDLRQAMKHGELHLDYQPIFDTQGLEIVGYEALVRWTHKVRGLLAPSSFIPIAEETGLIASLGHWILTTACAEAATWRVPRFVSVNLSAVQFNSRDILKDVTNILRRTGLPAELLELEITEGIMLDDPTRVCATLNDLRKLGVRIALDDFGTGYSSLSYLHMFPFDKIKIDRAFVHALDRNRNAAVIFRTMVALGHSLNMEVTAEGIETAAQLAWVRHCHCDQVQGFLLARPGGTASLPHKLLERAG